MTAEQRDAVAVGIMFGWGYWKIQQATGLSYGRVCQAVRDLLKEHDAADRWALAWKLRQVRQ